MVAARRVTERSCLWNLRHFALSAKAVASRVDACLSVRCHNDTLCARTHTSTHTHTHINPCNCTHVHTRAFIPVPFAHDSPRSLLLPPRSLERTPRPTPRVSTSARLWTKVHPSYVHWIGMCVWRCVLCSHGCVVCGCDHEGMGQKYVVSVNGWSVENMEIYD